MDTRNVHTMTLRALLLMLIISFPALSRAQVSFSNPGGYYSQSFSLTLSAGAGQQIHYTTDGSTPTTQSPQYSQPLLLSKELYSTQNIYLIRETHESQWNPPASVDHAIVLRAAAFSPDGSQVGKVITHTYLVTELLGRAPQLPAVSIALDKEKLFDPDSGIFSPNGFTLDDPFNTGNFNQHGREWERLANVEYLEPQGGGFSQLLGIRAHGGTSRQLMQKALKLYARSEYGTKKISYPLFDELPYESFKRLVLKPFSAAWTEAGVQDRLANAIGRPLHFLSLASRPVALYINGEYWGIYYLQESPDERLIEQIDDVDETDVDLIGSWLGLEENGSNEHFMEFMRWLETANLADSLQYQHICSTIDIDNFIDYQLFESFIANGDWPANNMRCYQHGSSLWRWIFYDGDGAFINANVHMDSIITYQGDDSWPSCREATLCLRKLLDSPQFVQRFGERLYQLTYTDFSYTHTAPLLMQARQEIAAEVSYQSQRFGTPQDSSHWEQAINRIDLFLRQRPDTYFQQMLNLIGLPLSDGQPPRLYPNPAHDYVNIEMHVQGLNRCILYDIMGRPVLSQSVSVHPLHPTIQLNLQDLPAGVYILSLIDLPQTPPIRIIKQ